MRSLAIPAALLGCGLAAQAHASAWTQPEGRGQVIVTGMLSHSDKGFTANGDTVDIDDYDKAETFVLIEYGVTDDLTVMAIPSFSHIAVENRDRTTGPGYTELGARYRIASNDAAVASFQASFRLPGNKRQDSIAQAGSIDTEIDLRALAGTSFQVDGKDGFVDAQAGYRIRNGAPPNEFRLEVTMGIRPTAKLLLMLQSFNIVSDGNGGGIFSEYRYSNLSASVVYDVTPKWSIQAGLLGTLAGRNALRERGVLLGLWRRF